MRLTLDEIAGTLSLSSGSVPQGLSSGVARHFNAGSEVRAVSTDSRTIGADDLFVALRGERFDGHDYIAKAFDSGALAAVVDHVPSSLAAELQEKCLVVPDTLVAYGQIARLWREKFDIPVVGVTGSVGKTTTKEITALALSPLGPVLKSEENENNEVGVPQTLLRLNETYKAAVIEMGMRGRGQIAYLANIARPTIGVITVIGESHIELLGSREAIADAKGELLESLPESGFAVLSADDDYFLHLRGKTRAQLVVTSTKRERGLHAENISASTDGWRAMVCEPDGERVPLTLKSPARHDIGNALLALGVALAAGVVLRDAVNALERYAPPAMRMESFTTRSGAIVLNDSYNASPTSMKSALDTLAGYQGATRRIAFLGDMKELGDHSAALHREVADFARSLKLSAVYAVGEAMGEALPEASGHFATSEDAARFAVSDLSTGPGDVVLVKGSRAMAMEHIAEALRNR